MFPNMKPTRMLSPTPGERTERRVILIFVYFLAVYCVSNLGRSLISLLREWLLPEADSAARMLFQLFGTVATIVPVVLWVRLFEKRSFVTLGFVRRGAVAEYLVGIVAGVTLFAGAVGICLLGGVAEVRVAADAPSWWLSALFLAGFLMQGMSEELLCRSFLMVSLSRRWPLWACAVTNAAVFSALHLFNPHVTPIALLNIFLFGLLASALTLRRGSIWMVAALHSLWNFAQGNLFGIPVSGLVGMPAPLTTALRTETLPQRLIGGGAFGIEGGLAATAILAVGLLIVMLLPTKRCEVVTET